MTHSTATRLGDATHLVGGILAQSVLHDDHEGQREGQEDQAGVVEFQREPRHGGVGVGGDGGGDGDGDGDGAACEMVSRLSAGATHEHAGASLSDAAPFGALCTRADIDGCSRADIGTSIAITHAVSRLLGFNIHTPS